ncbi:hypothetical protein [Posidoniimonas polymericola]|uniref:hypothetical protein n=1 Tax=Posidoniimonas polymericola TaxID=2528002 RepID=UPI0011B83A23|nr:hypothetical protein [Posidoniimonas polymericola]
MSITAGAAHAATSWDGDGNSNWWFDPANWSAGTLIPPAQLSGDTVVATDAQINVGSGPWDLTGEGVVYDPDNDPFFAAAASLTYPTGSNIAGSVGSDYGPQHIYRLYISRNTTNSNLLTIKSGDLAIESTTIIGRSGSTAGNENLGQITQTGGRLNIPSNQLDIGNSEDSGWGNGAYEYLGGTMDISMDSGSGIRLGHGRSSGPSGVNRFVIGNGAAGHVRTWDYISISYRGSADGVFTEGQDPNGVDRGVAITEFVFQNGGFRPMQVARNVTLNNGLEANTGATLSSRLVLSLDEAPAVDGLGVPSDMGLFDVDFDIGFGSNGGVVNGFGDIDNDTLTDAVFAWEDGAGHYLEGDTVSAMFGGTRYDWTISYTGDITWTDADNSIVNTISGAGSGGDIVLMGLGSEFLGLQGDYNGDDVVDAADYTVWRAGNSPDSSQAGYDLWAANYGSSIPAAASAAVPEPVALSLLASTVLLTGVRRRR